MNYFEYKKVQLSRESEQQELNQLGYIGWELVAVVFVSAADEKVFYLKREVHVGHL